MKSQLMGGPDRQSPPFRGGPGGYLALSKPPITTGANDKVLLIPTWLPLMPNCVMEGLAFTLCRGFPEAPAAAH